MVSPSTTSSRGSAGGGGGSMKVRFDGLDVTAMVANVQRVMLGHKVVNIYDDNTGGTDSSSGTFVFKMQGSSAAEKTFLLMESGIRFHPLQQQHEQERSNFPTPFCAKLRKHLRNSRLEQVHQLGQQERVVLFQFGVGTQHKHFVVLELYAKGNLILTNAQYTILALLRSHVYQPHVQVQVGHVYPVTFATTLSTNNNHSMATSTEHDITDQRPVEDDGNKETSNQQTNPGLLSMSTLYQRQEWLLQELQSQNKGQEPSTSVQKSKKGHSQQQNTLKTLLLRPSSGVSHYGPALLEHLILTADLPPHRGLAINQPDQTIRPQDDHQDEKNFNNSHREVVDWFDDAAWDRLDHALRVEGPAVVQALSDSSTQEKPGYILYKVMNQAGEGDDGNATASGPPEENGDLAHTDKFLEEFQPHLLKQHEGRLFIRYPNFGEAVDVFFAHINRQRRRLKAQAAQVHAKDKLAKVRQDQADRLSALQAEQERMRKQAEAVQQHADSVDKALLVINSALDSGMDWDQLEHLVAVEQQNQNPIALLIHKLELDRDSMMLRLPVDLSDNDDDEYEGGDGTHLHVRVSLKESAHANASSLFAKYRASKEKSQKTQDASAKALKAAEESARRQLADAQKRSKQVTVGVRKAAWFEKFHWFITSNNYLVLGGRDAHQNELLVKRYLRPGDAYLHADIAGASSCILRAKRVRLPNGNTEVVPLSEQALREAGNFTVCLSSAWSKKIVTSAWWVESHQVSKTAPTGEFLTVGSFMIRGKKNFLPPAPLEMGMALLFRLGDDDSIARHKNDRRDFELLQMEEEMAAQPKASTMHTEDMNSKESSPSVRGTDLTGVDGSGGVDSQPSSRREADAAESSNDGEGDKVVHAEVNFFEYHEGVRATLDPADPEGLLGRDEPLLEKSSGSLNKQKRGLSARDRKLLKKFGSLEEAQRIFAEREQSVGGAEADLESYASTEVAQSTDGQESLKRGRKNKLKRIKQKYADQDEEDRALAMQALQGGTKEKKRTGKSMKVPTSETQEIVAADTMALLAKDSSKIASKLAQEVQDVLLQCCSAGRSWDQFDSSVLEQLEGMGPVEAQLAAANRLLQLKLSTKLDNLSSSLAGIVRTIKKHGYDGPDTVQSRNVAQEKGTQQDDQIVEDNEHVDDDLEDGAVDDTPELFKLAGRPHAEDLLLYAVPVCAPYSTVSQYLYRVKLTPGNLKRGKAAKQCIDIFLTNDSRDSSEGYNRQRDLIKKLNENDVVHSICPDVKISAPGASKIAKKQKEGKKSTKN